ncbi:PAS domain S-box protein [Candidatus Chlorohelix sp.]|uniref:PAS domain S-box protein n=1 Tax=Candidatus Chlorohelix sp. TaxID=3139201 RepID=UPI0030361986
MTDPILRANGFIVQILEHNPLLVAGEVMATGAFTAFLQTPLLEIIELMDCHAVDSVVIVGETARIPLGLIMARDILRVMAAQQELASLRAENVMSALPVTVLPDTPLLEVYRLLKTHQLAQLVVTDTQGTLAGIVCWHNLSAALIRRLANEKLELPQNHEVKLESLAQIRIAKLEDTVKELTNALVKRKFQEKRADVIMELEKSNERFSKIFYSSPTPMAIYRASNFKMLEANDSLFKLIGYSREEIADYQSLPPKEKIYPNLQQADKFIETIYNKDSLNGFELEFYNKAHERTVVLLSAERIELGGEACFVMQAINITERKRSEEALLQSEARFQTFMDNSPALSWITDVAGNIVYLSPTYGRVTGIDGAKAIGKSAYELYPKDYADSFIATIRQVAETGQNVEALESFPRLDGTFGYVVSYKFLLPDYFGQTLVGGVAIDLTEREHAKEALRVSEERYRKVTEIISDYAYSYLIQPDGTVFVEWITEQPFYRLTGYSADEIPQNNFISIIHPDDRERALNNAVNPNLSEVFGNDYRIVTKSGEIRWVFSRRYAEWDETHTQVIRIYGSIKDITERKLAEEAVRESEQKFFKLFRSNPAAITLGSMLDGRYLDVNDKWLELTGYKAEDVIGKDFRELQLWDIPQDSKNIMADLRIKGYLQDIEMKLYKKNREAIDTLSSFELVEIGGQSCALSFSIDITERKQAEKALRDKEEQFRALVENSPDLIMRMDRQLRMVYGNPTVLWFSHHPRQEMLGKTGAEMGMGQSIWSVLQKLSQLVEETKTMQITELEGFISKSNQKAYFQTSLIPEFNANGEIETFLSVTTDLTALKLAQQELINQARFKTLFEFSPDSVILLDNEGTIISLNRAVEEFTGYSREELIGRKVATFKPISSDLFEQFLELMQSVAVVVLSYPFEFELILRNGTLVTAEARAQAIMLDGNKSILVSFRDITRHKTLEQELRGSIEKQRELTELKTRFVSMASHEFRTPLTVILSSAQLLEGYRERFTPERVAELYSRIVSSVKNITGLLDEMLFLNRAEAGMVGFKPAPLDLSLYCSGLVEEVRFGAGTQHHFELEIAPAPRQVFADTKLLRPVVLNLLNNAVKYSSSNSVIRVKLEYTATQAIGTITDEGIGIPPENMLHLYDMFYRADNVGEIQGTGLGLPIVKMSLLTHGGDIEIESEINKGTTCRFWIPI